MDGPLDPTCGVGRALNIIGERWTMLILRDLFVFGPRKFSEFEASLPGIAATTLSSRIKRLEQAGIIEREEYSQHPPRYRYGLTEVGKELGPALKALREWGEKHA